MESKSPLRTTVVIELSNALESRSEYGCANTIEPLGGWGVAKARLQELFANPTPAASCTSTMRTSASPSASPSAEVPSSGKSRPAESSLYLGLIFAFAVIVFF